jgi:uncharacterized protein (DUF1499 family)
MSVATAGPFAALALAGAACGLLVLAPLGYRLEWWPYGFGLYRLLPLSGLLALTAIIMASVTLLRGRSRLKARGIALLIVALVLGATLVFVPGQYAWRRNTLPAIHDISTDTDNPPQFSAVLPARAAERARSLDDRRPQLAQLQKAAYPDLAPIMTALPTERAFAEALAVAQSMPGWTIVTADADAGRIEASEQSRWFRFTDDVVIRIVGDEAGTRIDMRSTSRQGSSDYGVNAQRIRAYLAALRQRIQ